MSLLFRKRIVTAKIEATYGTDSSPTGAEAILVRNLDVTPANTEFVSREIVRPFLGNFDDIPVATSVIATFQVELAGSGAAGTAPSWGQLMRACGFAETITPTTSVEYDPVSEDFESVTMTINVDGIQHLLLGVRGNVALNMVSKDIPTLDFTMTGLYGGVVDAAPVVPVYTGFQKPLGVNNVNTTGFTIHGYAGCMQSLSLDMGNNIAFRTLVGCETVELTDRLLTGNVVIEAPLTAEKDFFAINQSGATGAIAITHGTVAGNIVTVSVPQAQLKTPTYQEQDQIVMLAMEIMGLPTNAGNDEFKLTLT